MPDLQGSPDELNETTCHINLTDCCTMMGWQVGPVSHPRTSMGQGGVGSRAVGLQGSAGPAARQAACCVPAGGLLFGMAPNNNAVCATEQRCQIPFVHLCFRLRVMGCAVKRNEASK